jgi:hypothetical protein
VNEKQKREVKVELSNKMSKLSIKLHSVVCHEEAKLPKKKHILHIFIIISAWLIRAD